MFFVWILSAVALCVAITFMRFALIRSVSAIKIKRCCRKNKYRITPRRAFWYLGNRNSKYSELCIEKENELLSVKFFGSYRKNTKIIITQNRRYFIRKYYVFLSARSISLQFSDSKPNPFDEFVFESVVSEKPIRKIILVDPQPLEIKFQPKHGQETIISSGDELFGTEIYTLNSFIANLL